MADGTIRGTFDLNADPALRGIRSIRSAAAESDVAVRQLGSSLDSIGGMNTQRKLDSTSGNVRDIASAAEEARVGVEELGSALDEVGRKRASAHVEVNGVAAALADVKALEAALDRLDRRNAQARIGTTGGFGGGASAAAQSAAGGGGGRRGGLLSSLGKSGPGGVPMGLLALGAGAVAPLGGAALGLAGSAASAAAGAGVVGGVGLGTLGIGLAPTVFGVKQFAASVKQAETAQKAYNTAVAQYGAASKQAATAKSRMDAVFGQNPGARRAISELQQLRQAARAEVTQPVRRTITNAAGSILHDVRTRALPTLAPGIRADATATAGAATTFSGFATAPGGPMMMAAVAMQREFARDAPIMEQSLQNIATLFSNVARASLPYFHEANLWVRNTTQGWASWSNNTTKVNAALDHGVTSFKQWRDLAGATFTVVRDLFSAGRPSGDSMVGNLTTQMDKWDVWIRNNPDKLHQFFRDAERDTTRIAGAVWEIAKALGQVSNLLAPILGRMAQLVSTFGAAGLLVPTALRIGAGRLFNRGAGGTVVGAGAGVGGGAVGGAGVAAVAGRAGQLPVLVTPGSYLAPRGIGAQRLTPLATPEVFAQRYPTTAYPGARYGGPVSTAGARAYGLNRLTAPAGRIGRAVIGYGGPILAANAALSALSTPGTVDQRVQAAFSGATLGILPAPVLGSDQRARGQAQAQMHLQNFAQPTDMHMTDLRIGALRRRIATLAHPAPYTPDSGIMGAVEGTTRAPTIAGRAESAVLKKELQRAIGIQKSMLDAAAVQQAQSYSSHFGAAFTVASKREGPVKAAHQMTGDILSQMQSMRPAGRRVMAQNALTWLNQAQKDNPALHGEYTKLKKDIVAEYDGMGQHIAIVNGQILDGSTSQWKKISAAITDPLNLAVARGQKSFTTLQQEAAKALTLMGYTGAQAHAIIQGTESGASLATVGGSAQHYGTLARQANNRGATPKKATGGRLRAEGGRLPGIGLHDKVRMSDGGYGAPGEMVLNRHTEYDINRDLMAAGRPTVEQRVNGETRWHSMSTPEERYAAHMRARGGGVGHALSQGLAATSLGATGASGLHPAIASIMQTVLNHFPGLSVTSTTGGGHAANSYHYRGEAVDLAGGTGTMYSAAQWVKASGLAAQLAEGIHNPNLSVKFGHAVSPSFWGSGTWAQHANHIHLAATGAVNTAGFAAGGAMGAGSISLTAPRSGLRGVPGALADRVAQIQATGLQRKINRRLGAMAGMGSLGGFTGGGSSGANQRLGHQMMIAAGWPESQWPALRSLWQKESNWLPETNSSSGAYGIPQALGHGHPFDISDIPGQIRWGLNYIRSTYGSPAAAWAHEVSHNWYGEGGRLGGGARPSWLGWFNRGTDFTTTPGRPVIFGAGEGRRERIRIEPHSRQSNSNGGGGHSFHFDFSGATITSEAHAQAVGEMVVSKVIEALDRGQVPDSAVAG